eukprot:1148810-Pelagomonas_calceolata.AAC.4
MEPKERKKERLRLPSPAACIKERSPVWNLNVLCLLRTNANISSEYLEQSIAETLTLTLIPAPKRAERAFYNATLKGS